MPQLRVSGARGVPPVNGTATRVLAREGLMDIVCCPSCDQPAEIVWRTHLSSTDGAVEHVRLRCLAQHVFLMPAAGLIPMCSAEADGLDGPVHVRGGRGRS
jgi:uncharacterized protein YbaR (Trm112 family)